MKILLRHPVATTGTLFLLLSLAFIHITGSLYQTWSSYRQQQVHIDMLQEMPQKIDQQERQLAHLRDSLTSRKSLEAEILSFSQHLEALCQKEEVILIRLPELITDEDGRKRLVFSLQGAFARLLRILYQYEMGPLKGHLAYLKFQKKTFTSQGQRNSVLQAEIELLTP